MFCEDFIDLLVTILTLYQIILYLDCYFGYWLLGIFLKQTSELNFSNFGILLILFKISKIRYGNPGIGKLLVYSGLFSHLSCYTIGLDFRSLNFQCSSYSSFYINQSPLGWVGVSVSQGCPNIYHRSGALIIEIYLITAVAVRSAPLGLRCLQG